MQQSTSGPSTMAAEQGIEEHDLARLLLLTLPRWSGYTDRQLHHAPEQSRATGKYNSAF